MIPYMHRKVLEAKIEDYHKRYKVLYFSAKICCGKTMTIRHFLDERQITYEWVSCGRWETLLPFLKLNHHKSEVLVLDDYQMLAGEKEKQDMLLQFLAAQVDQKTSVWVIGRSRLPKEWKLFVMQGKLLEIREKYFFLSQEETKEYLQMYDVKLKTAELSRIYEMSKGYLCAMNFAVVHMNHGEHFSEVMYQSILQDLYVSVDKGIYETMKCGQKLLLSASLFEYWTSEMMETLLEEPLSEELDYVKEIGNFVLQNEEDEEWYYLMPFMRQFFLQKGKNCLLPEEKRKYYEKGGFYLKGVGRTKPALEAFYQSGNLEEMRILLEEICQVTPANSDLYEMEKYFNDIPPKWIENSPNLLTGFAMLMSLKNQIAKSEEYIHRLESIQRDGSLPLSLRQNAAAKLGYLSFALPHFGSKHMIRALKNVSLLILHGQYHFSRVNVTGNMPSLMNGGKDFCRWSSYDTALRSSIGSLIQKVLGVDGVGVPNIGVGESFYERNCLDEALEEVTKGIDESYEHGSVETWFAGQGVKAKIFAAQGQLDGALRILKQTQERLEAEKKEYCLENLFALRVQFLLYENRRDTELEKKLPPIQENEFWLKDRFALLTWIRLLMAQGRYEEAAVLLEKLLKYANDYQRVYYRIECRVLKSILFFRRGRDWEPVFQAAVREAEKYHFIRVIAKEGAAVMEMLKTIPSNRSYYRQLILAARRQMLFYPEYMKLEKQQSPLTKYELEVIKLMALGKSNQEIAEELHIAVATVKYHSGNIYRKLDVKNRAAAVYEALRMGILGE